MSSRRETQHGNSTARTRSSTSSSQNVIERELQPRLHLRGEAARARGRPEPHGHAVRSLDVHLLLRRLRDRRARPRDAAVGRGLHDDRQERRRRADVGRRRRTSSATGSTAARARAARTSTSTTTGTDFLDDNTGVQHSGSPPTSTPITAIQTTIPIEWNATADVVQAALEQLPSIGAGNVSVTGCARQTGTSSSSTPWATARRRRCSSATRDVPALERRPCERHARRRERQRHVPGQHDRRPHELAHQRLRLRRPDERQRLARRQRHRGRRRLPAARRDGRQRARVHHAHQRPDASPRAGRRPDRARQLQPESRVDRRQRRQRRRPVLHRRHPRRDHDQRRRGQRLLPDRPALPVDAAPTGWCRHRPDDLFVTIDTTKGWLSNGIWMPMTINGGVGDDNFVVFHNIAKLDLNGDEGDDTFIVQAFALRVRRTTTAADRRQRRRRRRPNPVRGQRPGRHRRRRRLRHRHHYRHRVQRRLRRHAQWRVRRRPVRRLRQHRVARGRRRRGRRPVLRPGHQPELHDDDRRRAGQRPVRRQRADPGQRRDRQHAARPQRHHHARRREPRRVLGHVHADDGPYAGIDVVGISANVADNDTPGVVVTPTDGSSIVVEGDGTSFTVAAGTEDSFDVTLTRPPDTNVIVSVAITPPEGLVLLSGDGGTPQRLLSSETQTISLHNVVGQQVALTLDGVIDEHQLGCVGERGRRGHPLLSSSTMRACGSARPVRRLGHRRRAGRVAVHDQLRRQPQGPQHRPGRRGARSQPRWRRRAAPSASTRRRTAASRSRRG